MQKKTHRNKNNVENLNQVRKKLVALDKVSWFNQNVFWDEIEGRNVKQKIIRPGDDIDFQSDSDNDDGIYSVSSHLRYVVVDLKLLEAALAVSTLPWTWLQNIFGKRFR